MESRDSLILLLRDIRDSLGGFAWLFLGTSLVLAVLGCLIGLRWIWRGGMKNTGRKFFGEQREIKHALKLP